MLTDVFVSRYEETPIWPSYDERARRFMVQAAKLITEQLFPYYVGGNENKFAKDTLQLLHDRLAMEIGIDPLSPLFNGTYRYPIVDILKNFMQRPFEEQFEADVFIKRRISLVELAMREFEGQVKKSNETLPSRVAAVDNPSPFHELARSLNIPSATAEGLEKHNQALNQQLRDNVQELNERFTQARFPLVYHNGFVQLSGDEVLGTVVEKPFWALVAEPQWKSVEHDMLEAVDRRDTRGRDPAFHAAKALESAIKIISDLKGWTRGPEGGAAAYIDNLVSQKNGRFIDPFEAEALKFFFSKVRNPLGHGAGANEIIELTDQQDAWAIETCMSWIKSLINRM